eukprot:TRINITY_DN7113_c0_g1_i4.p2 TRINITY_DN7113_c0_g1~~TRINITY_DN7113_c0_g1_i4.p2  ORF type:complete len:134 (-),score=26.24 TRINITY_DN7113_c0_g1_i4:369-770(-)
MAKRGVGQQVLYFFFFQAEDGIRDHAQSRGLGDVYKRQVSTQSTWGINASTWGKSFIMNYRSKQIRKDKKGDHWRGGKRKVDEQDDDEWSNILLDKKPDFNELALKHDSLAPQQAVVDGKSQELKACSSTDSA